MSEQFWRRLNYIFGLLTIGVLFGLVAFMASLEVKDLDLWLHLKMGQYISEHHAVPAHDVLSCSIAGKPWVNHEWLFQVIVYQVWKAAGFDGLIHMQIAVVFLTFMILLLLGYSKERQFLAALFLFLVLLIYQTRFTIRPDIFSLLFFSSFVWILAWFMNRRWSWWALVIIQILWANMHGFFFFGPLLVMLGIASEFLKRRVPLPWNWNKVGRLTDEEYRGLQKLLLWLIAACCVNPYLFKGAWYPLGVLLDIGHSGAKVFFTNITELQKPVTLANLWTGQNSSYKALILLSGIGLFLNRRRVDINWIFIWAVFLFFSLAAIRNMVFFAAASYLVFMSSMSTIKWPEIVPFRFSNERFKYITAILLKLFLTFWMIDMGTKMAANGYFNFDTYQRKSEFWGVSLRTYPYHAADFLVKNKIKGNFFNDFNSGAYLIGRAYPNIKVYMDGRTEEYGGEFFEGHYQKIWREGDQKVFLADSAKYNLTGVFLNNNNQQIPPKVLRMIYQLPDWKIIYFDYDAVIFLKDIPENKAAIDRFKIDLSKWHGRPMDLQKLGTKRMEPVPLTNRAYLLKTLGFYDAAIKEAQNAIKVSPDDFESHKILGESYQAKGDNRRSFENFRLAAILRPYKTENRLNLAEAYIRLKDFKGAQEQYERALEMNAKNSKIYFGLAKLYALMGKDKQALDYLTQAQALDHEDTVDVKEIHDIMDNNKSPKKIKEPLKKKS